MAAKLMDEIKKDKSIKGSATKTITIKVTENEYKVFSDICAEYNRTKQELGYRALSVSGLFDDSYLNKDKK